MLNPYEMNKQQKPCDLSNFSSLSYEVSMFHHPKLNEKLFSGEIINLSKQLSVSAMVSKHESKRRDSRPSSSFIRGTLMPPLLSLICQLVKCRPTRLKHNFDIWVLTAAWLRIPPARPQIKSRRVRVWYPKILESNMSRPHTCTAGLRHVRETLWVQLFKLCLPLLKQFEFHAKILNYYFPWNEWMNLRIALAR